MANQVKLNIFVKEKKNQTAGNKFKSYSTKDKNDVFYDVRFTQECENRNLLPNNLKPFVCVVSSNHMSQKDKNYVTVDENGEVTGQGTNHILYIDKIDAIEEYIRPDYDTSNF